jgi:histidine ammonia-lyase
MSEDWTRLEAEGVSDNPVIDEGDQFSMGGNFYGGYISHAMDYLKISMAHLADMVDRQFMCLIDESTNRGLPPNLADWPNITEDERFLNHGLKGLNQAMSALTSEVMAQSNPGGIHSRSSESHNQDKVSLGLSACIQMNNMFENLYTLLSIHLIGCVQAIDLRDRSLKSKELRELYDLVRNVSPKVTEDRAMDFEIAALKQELKLRSGVFNEKSL